ncbi:MAG TPA: response regulator [Chthoniobacterales bacterium]|nr:response regulator [Chthoniobacterales bacterium]
MNEATLKGAHILMVDDEVSSTCLMTNFLNRIGYTQLQSINDSTRALEAVETFGPDLILLDLNMPGLDGFDILSALRADRHNEEQIPVLVLTGDPSAKNKRRALAAGATDLLVKPFDPSEVSMRIRNLLQAHFLRFEIQEQNRLLEQRVSERTCALEKALSDLRAAQRQAVQQERLSAFGEMAGGVVHDFSNALMSVIGYSEMLITNATARADEATALEYLRIINTAGRDGAHVVSRLRDFYRPRGAADLFESLDLNEIVKQSIALARPRCATRENNRAVSFQTHLATEATAAGIGAEFREVLTNLIFNALDAIPGAGVITLGTRYDAGEVFVEVTDTGVGMSADVRQRCLEPFFTTKGDHGTGLGLAMVFGIIKRHQGTLEIDSEPGEGTTVRIRLPGCPLETRQNEVTPVLECAPAA